MHERRAALLRLSQLLAEAQEASRQRQLGASRAGEPAADDGDEAEEDSDDDDDEPTNIAPASSSSSGSERGSSSKFDALVPAAAATGAAATRSQDEHAGGTATPSPEAEARQALTRTLAAKAAACLPLVSAGDAATIAYALARLDHPDPPLLQGLMSVAVQQRLTLNAWQVVGLLWGAAHFRQRHALPVSPTWLSHLLETAEPMLCQLNGMQLAMVAHACAALGQRPSKQWLGTWLSVTSAALPSCSPRQLSTILWATAKLRVHPGQSWLQAFLDAADAQSWSFTSGPAIANMLWALATLRHRPPQRWLEHMLWQAQRHFKLFDLQSMSVMLWAVAALDYQPHPVWAKKLLRHAYRRLRGGAVPRTLSTLLWACATLRIRPPQHWLWIACSELHPHLAAASPRDAATLVWALGRLQYKPSEDWFFDLYQSAQPQAFAPLDAVMTVHGFALLHRRFADFCPDDAWLRGLAHHTAEQQQQLGALRTDQLVAFICDLAASRQPLPGSVVAQLLAAVHAHLGGMTPSQLANACHGAAQLSRRAADQAPPLTAQVQALVDSALAVTQARLQQFNLVDLLRLLLGLSAFERHVGSVFLSLHEARCAELLQAATSGGDVSGLLAHGAGSGANGDSSSGAGSGEGEDAGSSDGGGGGSGGSAQKGAAGPDWASVRRALTTIHACYQQMGYVPSQLPPPQAVPHHMPPAWASQAGQAVAAEAAPPPPPPRGQQQQHVSSGAANRPQVGAKPRRSGAGAPPSTAAAGPGGEAAGTHAAGRRAAPRSRQPGPSSLLPPPLTPPAPVDDPDFLYFELYPDW